jgi:hypothetical protein
VSLSFHHLVNAHQFQRLDVYRSIFRDIDRYFANGLRFSISGSNVPGRFSLASVRV